MSFNFLLVQTVETPRSPGTQRPPDLGKLILPLTKVNSPHIQAERRQRRAESHLKEICSGTGGRHGAKQHPQPQGSCTLRAHGEPRAETAVVSPFSKPSKKPPAQRTPLPPVLGSISQDSSNTVWAAEL